ncbi:MAG: hypothetical protein QOD40_564 [Alphaproteobacteria bacterium]|jgi:hypothetical protein|nr:hypothetical protein [Alphaproteobacteria bacterium]
MPGTFHLTAAKAAAIAKSHLDHFKDEWGELRIVVGLDPSGLYYLEVDTDERKRITAPESQKESQ